MKLNLIFLIHLREIFYVYFNYGVSSGFGVSFKLTDRWHINGEGENRTIEYTGWFNLSYERRGRLRARVIGKG